jgi:hypothetical protein
MEDHAMRLISMAGWLTVAALIGVAALEAYRVRMPPSAYINCARRQLVNEGCGRGGFDEARPFADDSDALRCDLLRQILAVGAERRLRGGIREGRLKQREVALDRGGVDDHAGSLCHH